MEKSTNKSLYSCVLDMNLAAYFSGDQQVRRVAKSYIRLASKPNKTALKKIVKSKHPSQLVDVVFKEISPKVEAAYAAKARSSQI